MFAEIRQSLADFGVALRRLLLREGRCTTSGELERGARAGCASRATSSRPDGAIWLRTTDFGDDKDRVLVRRDGEPTYFAADCAYYLDKRERGFDKVVIMLGADHHGYVGRLQGAGRGLPATTRTSTSRSSSASWSTWSRTASRCG